MNIAFPEISKRLLAVSGATLIGLAALTACGGGETGTDSDTGSTGETAEGAAADDEAAGGDGTSPESPLPAGSTVEVTDWTLTATGTLDATEAILASDEFNEAPAEGFQQALVTLEGTYNGDASGSLWTDASFGIWADGTFYDSLDCMNTVENDLMDVAEVSAGSSATGSACVEVPAGAESYLIYIEDIWAMDGTQYFIEIG
jgi:hypothetical protein